MKLTDPDVSDADANTCAAELWPSSGAGAIPSMGELGLNQFTPYLLNRISADWNSALSDKLRGLGITTTKMRVLAVLSVSPGITINELSVLAVTEQSTMSRTLDALEEQGLIRRQPKTDDMRVREVYVTEAGQALFARLWPVMYGLYERQLRGVGEAEFRAFLSTLHKIMRNARED
jgi:MarR family transcriptional regulator for hemolysin